MKVHGLPWWQSRYNILNKQIYKNIVLIQQTIYCVAKIRFRNYDLSNLICLWIKFWYQSFHNFISFVYRFFEEDAALPSLVKASMLSSANVHVWTCLFFFALLKVLIVIESCNNICIDFLTIYAWHNRYFLCIYDVTNMLDTSVVLLLHIFLQCTLWYFLSNGGY